MAVLLATTQAPGGAKPQFPPFNAETFASQIIWFAITFVLLYFLMSRVALPLEADFAARRFALPPNGRLTGEVRVG